MAPHLQTDEFFSSLTDLLAKTTQKSRGSVTLSQKPLIDNITTTQPSILIRATDGNTSAPRTMKDGKVVKAKASKATRVKFSTVVPADQLEAFYTRYAEICKTGMTGLKKRDRKRKAKGKGGAKAAKA
ncbi:hypothetical protein N7509_004960 [Penicillium cosmopolitanum]|uniref:Signal recognition particle subunit SRP14 n=1 Tax=Penicillium cosmopolitanum TaxID=1131564 RepID=A0A9W9W1N0_9EURO|nr:uncharacterized protein N7509_004960 [Penicillium cosmopolitanum]KAJ5396847.1 hypothetical protein N7509_004960 [Penicillium cosmopolitanum]